MAKTESTRSKKRKLMNRRNIIRKKFEIYVSTTVTSKPSVFKCYCVFTSSETEELVIHVDNGNG